MATDSKSHFERRMLRWLAIRWPEVRLIVFYVLVIKALELVPTGNFRHPRHVHHLGQGAAVLIVTAALALVLSWKPARRVVSSRLWWMARRRKVETGFFKAMDEGAPGLVSLQAVDIGEAATVLVPAGSSVPEIEKESPRLAAAFRCREVRVRQYEEDAGLAEVLIVKRETLEKPIRPDVLFSQDLSLHDRVPLGVDEDGRWVVVGLVGHHLLIGGEPGAGKSGTLSVVLAAAAKDPSVDIWALDGKRVELAPWRSVCSRVVGPEMEEAIATLDELRAEMDRRYDRLLERSAKKVEPGDGERTILVVLDELAFYVANGDKKAGQLFAEKLRDLVARARAAGIVVVAATQKPSTDLIPSALRDNFGYRIAHRCATREASDTILGSGWSSEGYSAATIPPRLRGVGYIIEEGGIPKRMRSIHLGDKDIARIVEEGKVTRHLAGVSP